MNIPSFATCGALLFSSVSPLLAGVAVSAGEISDKRTTGEFFSGLEIKLLISGPEMAQAKAMRCVIDKATDDLGTDLLKGRKESFREGEFAPLEKPFGAKAQKANEFETTVNLANPPRNAKTFTVSGKIELVSPSADPASVVEADLSKVAGKALDAPAVKAAGVEITFEKPKDDEITYKLKDPGKKVAAVEFFGADGKVLKTNGWSSFGFGATKTCTVTIPNLAGQVSARIQLLTDKSLVSVPVKLEKTALP